MPPKPDTPPLASPSPLPVKAGVMICGHGSRDKEGVEEFLAMTKGVRNQFPDIPVESGFLEFAKPTIEEGLETLRQQSVHHILAVPAMLFAAGHVKNDIPSELNQFARNHPEVTVRFGREMAIDPRMMQAAADRIEQAEALSPLTIPRSDSLLMVVGRGTNDPDANGNIAKISRILAEGLGYGWSEICFSGTAHPRVDEGLEIASRLGFRRIVVFPYFLFTGILVKRIREQTENVAARHKDIEFIHAQYFNDHPLVIDTLGARVHEILSGDNTMNCLLCKYRVQIIGYADDQGQPQAGHHHHVRGIGMETPEPDSPPPSPSHHGNEKTSSPSHSHHGHPSTHHHSAPTPGGKQAVS